MFESTNMVPLNAGGIQCVEIISSQIRIGLLRAQEVRALCEQPPGWLSVFPGGEQCDGREQQGSYLSNGQSRKYNPSLKRFGYQAAGMETTCASHLAMTFATDLVDQ